MDCSREIIVPYQGSGIQMSSKSLPGDYCHSISALLRFEEKNQPFASFASSIDVSNSCLIFCEEICDTLSNIHRKLKRDYLLIYLHAYCSNDIIMFVLVLIQTRLI